MTDRWMVVTEMHDENEGISYWYYGTYDNRNMANEVASNFVNIYPCYHVVINANEAEEWGVKNFPVKHKNA